MTKNSNDSLVCRMPYYHLKIINNDSILLSVKFSRCPTSNKVIYLYRENFFNKKCTDFNKITNSCMYLNLI